MHWENFNEVQGSFLLIEVYLYSSAIFSECFCFVIYSMVYLKYKNFYALSAPNISSWIFCINLCIWNKNYLDAI